jgi:hypothetical protein
MKPSLYKLLSKGERAVPVEGTFVRMSRYGHVLLRDISTPAGEEDHIWLNWRALPHGLELNRLSLGDRIRFIADLQEFRKKNGSRSVRLECVRELRRLNSEGGARCRWMSSA